MRLMRFFAVALLLAACGPGAEGPGVSQVLFGSSVNERQEITEPKEAFLPGDSVLHAHVFMQGLTGPEEIAGAWWYEPKGQKIFETSVPVTPGRPVAKFSLSSAKPWPAGAYRFTVTHEGGILFEKTVTVAAKAPKEADL